MKRRGPGRRSARGSHCPQHHGLSMSLPPPIPPRHSGLSHEEAHEGPSQDPKPANVIGAPRGCSQGECLGADGSTALYLFALHFSRGLYPALYVYERAPILLIPMSSEPRPAPTLPSLS